MVHEVQSSSEFHQLLRQNNKLVVVDFTATWCGPCQRIAPEYDALSRMHPDVLFLKVVESTCQDLIMELGIRAFPTFHFYLDGQKIDELKGADINAIRAKVIEYKARVQPSFGGEGFSLGGGGAAANATDARAARLARFGSAAPSGPQRGPDPETAARNARILAMDAVQQARASSGPTPMDTDDLRAPLLPPVAAAVAAGSAAGGDSAPPPAGHDAAAATAAAAATSGMASSGGPPRSRRLVDPEMLSQLVDMGFPEVRAKKAIMFSAGGDLDSVVTWLSGHQDDPDIDEPVPEPTAEEIAATDAAAALADQQAQSLKCDDCGALLRDMVAAELHAHKTGHSNFSESTAAIKPLTEEERAAKVAAIKAKLAARRAAREEEEKVDHVAREKARRFVGKEMTKTREEMDKQARKRAIDLQKREKEAAAAERERLRAEIAKDKAERKARGGKLAGKLGVDGYNPSAVQGAYGAPVAGLGAGNGAGEAARVAQPPPAAAPAAAAAAPAVVGGDWGGEGSGTSLEMAEKAVQLLSRQTVGAEGGTAMRTVMAYCRNALEKPLEEDKFRTINLDNKAFKARVAGCLGGVALLRAAGFAKDDANGRLYMSVEARDEAVLREVISKLDAALAAYQPTMASVK